MGHFPECIKHVPQNAKLLRVPISLPIIFDSFMLIVFSQHMPHLTYLSPTLAATVWPLIVGVFREFCKNEQG
jgi:hypothetical protein